MLHRSCDMLHRSTYVPYVELRQNLTGPSAIPTTPKRGIASLDSPGQQRVGIWRTASPDRRHIREGQQELGELIFEVLEILDVVQIVRHCVPQFRALDGKRVVKQSLVGC